MAGLSTTKYGAIPSILKPEEAYAITETIKNVPAFRSSPTGCRALYMAKASPWPYSEDGSAAGRWPGTVGPWQRTRGLFRRADTANRKNAEFWRIDAGLHLERAVFGQ